MILTNLSKASVDGNVGKSGPRKTNFDQIEELIGICRVKSSQNRQKVGLPL